MNITEYRQKRKLVQAAAKLLSSPDLKLMLDTLRQSAPKFYERDSMGIGAGLPAHDHSRMLGFIEGYSMCLKYLELLGQLPKPPQPVLQPTYPVPNSMPMPPSLKPTT